MRERVILNRVGVCGTAGFFGVSFGLFTGFRLVRGAFVCGSKFAGKSLVFLPELGDLAGNDIQLFIELVNFLTAFHLCGEFFAEFADLLVAGWGAFRRLIQAFLQGIDLLKELEAFGGELFLFKRDPRLEPLVLLISSIAASNAARWAGRSARSL